MNAFEATQAAFAEASASSGESAPPADTTTTQTPPADTPPEPVPATQGSETPKPAEESPSGSEDELPLTGNIPVPRHKAVLENARKKIAAEYETQIKSLEWAKEYTPDQIQKMRTALDFIDNQPLEFLERFEATLKADPRFAERLAARQSQRVTEKPKEEPIPLPDIDLEDGRRVYSDGQLLRLLDWQSKRVTSELEQRYKPLEESYRGQLARQATYQKVAPVLADARQNWDGFKENEQEIAAHLRKFPQSSLESAYRYVVVPKLKANKATMEAELRKTLIAELNAKPNVVTETPGIAAPAAPASTKGMTTADIVAQVARELA